MQYFKVILPVLLSRLGRKTPLEVFHTITTRCNLRCKYCCIWAKKEKEMNTEQIKTAIKEFAEAGTICWHFSGGEPLLRRDMGKLVNFANDEGIYTKINTNGILFKKRINELRRVDIIYFSLDGPKEIHEKMRGIGTYDKVIEAIKLAKEENFNVSISPVIHKDHIKNDFFGIRYLLDLAKKFDLGINLSTMTERGPEKYYEKIRNQFISLKDYLSILRLIREFSKKEHKLIHFSSAFSSGMVNEAIKMYKKKIVSIYKKESSKLKCYAGLLYCYIHSNGKISPCGIRTDIWKDGLKNGFLNAFYNLPPDKNCSCFSCYTTRNLLFSPNLNTLKNALLAIKI